MVLLVQGSSRILVASVYLDINEPVGPPWLESVFSYAAQKGYGLLVSVDTNTHSHLFGPTTNQRGVQLEDLVFQHGLTVQNIGQPHFPERHGPVMH